MQMWILLGVLIVAELFVFAKIPAALLRGAVPLNPLGWFGYSELMEVSVERDTAPAAYWVIVLLLTVLAAVFGVFIYVIMRGAAGA
jgi:Na+/melibiose symporter-like transporter